MNLGIESETLEFKKTTGELDKAMDNIASMLNKHGHGTLYFGVSPNGDVTGQQVSASSLNDVAKRIKHAIKPMIYPEIKEEVFDGRNVIRVDFTGTEKPYSSFGRYYKRVFDRTQIGMTATPKETKYISNIDYFGEPIYMYSLREGIEDGFLAPFRVINITTDISDGWRPRAGQLDIYGNEIEDRIYNNSDYDYNIVIEDRINQVALEITNYLIQTDRMAKTIVFCATEEHAERMRIALSNLNADMVKENPDYVVRITGSDTYGKDVTDYNESVAFFVVAVKGVNQ